MLIKEKVLLKKILTRHLSITVLMNE